MAAQKDQPKPIQYGILGGSESVQSALDEKWVPIRLGFGDRLIISDYAGYVYIVPQTQGPHPNRAAIWNEQISEWGNLLWVMLVESVESPIGVACQRVADELSIKGMVIKNGTPSDMMKAIGERMDQLTGNTPSSSTTKKLGSA